MLQVDHVVDGSVAILELLALEASKVGPNIDHEEDGQDDQLDSDQKADQVVEHVVTRSPQVEAFEVDKYSEKQVKVCLLNEDDLPAPEQGFLYLL